jgi:hypothetical protein
MARKFKPVPDGEKLNWLSYRIAQHENSIKELLATAEMHLREASSAVGQDHYRLAKNHAQMAKNSIDALLQDLAAFRQLNWAQNYTPPPNQKLT